MSDVMMVFTQTDLPEPVAPAMSRWGIFARSAITGRPSRSLPSATGRAARAELYSGCSTISRNATISGFGFGTSMPTAPFPGIGATIRMLLARIASARSFESDANCRTFTPAAGSTSNWVTVGPVVRPTSWPSTRKVRSAAISRTPEASSSRRLASRLRGGGSVSSDVGGRSDSASSSGCAVASIAAVTRSSRVGTAGLRRGAIGSTIAGTSSSASSSRSASSSHASSGGTAVAALFAR
ncbi:MAG: hypothetical protein MUF53_10115, partial [Gemmatimonadaceae bacterium]|nr:hypothetical protein [Gemmatimonadaceae bacterium]